MLSSKDGDSIFLLERDSTARGPVKLVCVDTSAKKISLELDLPVGTQTMCLTPDGSTIYVAVSTNGHTSDTDAVQEGAIVEIEAATLRIRRTVRVGHDPADIQANDSGLVYLSGGSGQHTQVVVVNMREGQSIVARWPGVYMGARIRLSPDQRRLFVTGTGSSPQTEAWLLPAKLSEKPAVEERLNDSPAIPLSSEFFLTPKDDFLMTRRGGIAPIRVAGGNG